MPVTTLRHETDADLLAVEPYLFASREYITAEDGTTTTCKSSATSPVAEYTPDD